MVARTHGELAPARTVYVANCASRADDLAAAREIRRRQNLKHLVKRCLGLVNQQRAGGRDLPQVVRGNVGRHADGNAGRAVEQHEGQLRGQNHGLLEVAVIVGREVDCPRVHLFKKQTCDRHEARFGVTHGSLRVAVPAAEVALAVDERIAEREALRHAHERIVDRLVAVGMVLAEHVAHDARRLDGLRARLDAHALHVDQNAALHGLLAVGDVGKRTALDDRHRVFKIGPACIARERELTVGFDTARHHLVNACTKRRRALILGSLCSILLNASLLCHVLFDLASGGLLRRRLLNGFVSLHLDALLNLGKQRRLNGCFGRCLCHPAASGFFPCRRFFRLLQIVFINEHLVAEETAVVLDLGIEAAFLSCHIVSLQLRRPPRRGRRILPSRACGCPRSSSPSGGSSPHPSRPRRRRPSPRAAACGCRDEA